MRFTWKVVVLGMLLVTVLAGAIVGASAGRAGNPGMHPALLEEDSPWAPWAADRRYLLELRTAEGNVTPRYAAGDAYSAPGSLSETSPLAPWAADRCYLLEPWVASK